MSKIKKVIKVGLKTAANPRNAGRRVKFIARKHAVNRKRRQEYIEWFDKQILSPSALDEQRKSALGLEYRPLVSILLPTYNTNPQYLRECIDSVLSQTYDNWELCISDDASPSEETKRVIREYVDKYDNIHATFCTTNGHIAVSSNVALDMAQGDYVSLLDHDDLLQPNALYETVAMINKHPDADLIYSDEDKIDLEGTHIEPFFKPDWSPDFLNSCNYITHFATIRHSVMKKVNGFTPGTQGAQDWDLFLRITSQTDKVYHISKILYTWRKSETSTAMSADSKPYAYINQRKVLLDNVAARGVNASVEAHQALGFWRVRYGIIGTPLVSIVIPTINNLSYIKRCIESIVEGTSYPYFEIVIVDTGSTDKKVLEYYEKLKLAESRVTIVDWKRKPFNYASACDFGVEHSKGEYILFLNNDTEIIGGDWMQGLLEHAQRPSVGMVGARLLFPNMTIQHAGVVLSERDVAFHPFYGDSPELDIFNYINIANIRNVSAVTGACCMVSRSKYDQVGGFDSKLRVSYNDVDLCLKLLDAGYDNVYTPFVELIHHESISVGRVNTSDRDAIELKESQDLMRKRWAKYLENDPYYNSNFEQHGPGYHLPM